MARKTSELLKNFEKLFEIMKLIIHAVIDMGGSDDDLIQLQNDPYRVRAAAAAILGRTLPPIEFTFHSFMRGENERYINGREMLSRAVEMPGQPCDKEYALMIIRDPTLVPEDVRGKNLIFEEWRPSDNPDKVKGCYWDRNGRLNLFWFDLIRKNFDTKNCVVVRLKIQTRSLNLCPE